MSPIHVAPFVRGPGASRGAAAAALRMVTLAALTLSAATARGQDDRARTTPRGRGWAVEIRPFAGSYVPTGTQRELLEDAGTLGGQLGLRHAEDFALTGTFAWALSKDRTTASRTGAADALYTGREESVDVLDYDAGVEARLPVAALHDGIVAPYLGAGAGARSYHYRHVDGARARTSPEAYGALGVDLVPARGRVGARVETRATVSRFDGLRAEYARRGTRVDLQLTVGLTVRP
jgi:hypothetical protein